METFLHAPCANLYTRTIWDTRPLKVWVYAAVTSWVEFCSTNRVRVLSNDFRTFFTKWTDFCHRFLITSAYPTIEKAVSQDFWVILQGAWYYRVMNNNLSMLAGFFPIIIVLFSIILHEVAHGYAAYVQGDQTAHRAGRLTLNPLPHIDMIGSVIVPLFAFLTAGTFFGWAKPVPYNPHNIRTRIGLAFVAAAGILTNIAIAITAGIAFKVLSLHGLSQGAGEALFTIIGVNISLAFFNLIPVPPFDGMAILQALFPRLHINSNFIYNPIYMIMAILGASVLYGMFMPHIFSFIAGVLA